MLKLTVSLPILLCTSRFAHFAVSYDSLTRTGVNRLDRLTSGLMILALTGPASTRLAKEFIDGHVHKEYLARVRGKFPDSQADGHHLDSEAGMINDGVKRNPDTGEITVRQNLLTVDRQMGLVICTPEGKVAETIFKRRFYDEERDESVVHCEWIGSGEKDGD